MSSWCAFCSSWSSSSWERLFSVSVSVVVVAAAAVLLPAAAAFFVSIARSAWTHFSFSASWAGVGSIGGDCPMGTS